MYDIFNARRNLRIVFTLTNIYMLRKICFVIRNATFNSNQFIESLPFSSSANAVDSTPAGRRTGGPQRHAGVLQWGTPDVAQLLDQIGRPDDSRLAEVPVRPREHVPICIAELTLRVSFLSDLMSSEETSTGTPGYKTHMRLTIFNVNQDDYGMYKCVAKNPRGETDGTIRVYSKYGAVLDNRSENYFSICEHVKMVEISAHTCVMNIAVSSRKCDKWESLFS